MSILPLSSSSTSADAADAGPATRLRVRLRQNAAFSALGGIVAAAGCVPVARAMGVADQWWLVLAVGLGLVGFAVLVWVAAARPADRLVVDAVEISIADATWVVASLVVAAGGVLSAFGVTTVIAQAAVVAFFGLTQLRLRRQLV